MKNTTSSIKASFFDDNSINTDFPEYFRQTEKFSGNFLNINYEYNNHDAEWQIIGTWTKNINKIKNKKIIYLQQEPPECKLPSSNLLDNVCCVISPFKFNHPAKQYITYTPLQWTYDLNISFSEEEGHKIKLANKNDIKKIKEKKIPKKKYICSMIVSSKAFLPGHKKRIKLLEKLVNHFKTKIDFYGFGFNPILNKKNAIDPYIFSIGIENSSLSNYWTEKISDIYLGYTCPIYYGCKNINHYFDEKTFYKINIDNLDSTIFFLETILDNPFKYKPSNYDLYKERKKILNEYNFFKSITNVINIENNKF